MRISLPQLGMAVGLVSLTFFFAGLILAFGLRIGANTEWVPFHMPALLWVGTGLIVISSATLESARHALRRALVSACRVRLLITVVLGGAFVVTQTLSALDLIRQGVAVAGNPRGSAFYTFMSIHAAHLLGGMIWLVVLWRGSSALFRGTEQDLRRQRRNISAAAMFWHFMGALWLVLFWFLHRWAER